MVVKMAEEAAAKALEASKKRVEESKEMAPAGTRGTPVRGSARSRADIYGNLFLMEQRRHKDLEEAIAAQKIGPVSEDGVYSLASLHATIIRRISAANERLSQVEEAPKKSPILRIHPTRYEVIIDINLEYPGGREEARRWIYQNIEEAKNKAKVYDAGQDVHLKKEQRESGYMFACLEARTIKALIELDVAQAKVKAREAQEKVRGTSHEAKARAAKINPAKFRAIFRIWPDFEISASDYPLHRHDKSRCGEEFLFRAGRRNHLGSDGFRNKAGSWALSNTTTSIKVPHGIKTLRLTATARSTMRTDMGRMWQASLPASGVRPVRQEEQKGLRQRIFPLRRAIPPHHPEFL